MHESSDFVPLKRASFFPLVAWYRLRYERLITTVRVYVIPSNKAFCYSIRSNFIAYAPRLLGVLSKGWIGVALPIEYAGLDMDGIPSDFPNLLIKLSKPWGQALFTNKFILVHSCHRDDNALGRGVSNPIILVLGPSFNAFTRDSKESSPFCRKRDHVYLIYVFYLLSYCSPQINPLRLARFLYLRSD